MAAAMTLSHHAVQQYAFKASDVKQEPLDEHLFPPLKEEFDSFDLDSALFDVDIGWDNAEGLDACFFEDPLPTDGTVPSLSGPSDANASISLSASCSSLDSSCSSDSVEELLGGRVPTGARSRRAGGCAPNRPPAVRRASATVVPAARPWAAPTVLPPLTMTRQERVQRYREKRKRRTFEKTIRYEARRAYAEVRPRIKGRFATKDEAAAMKAAKLAGVPYEC